MMTMYGSFGISLLMRAEVGFSLRRAVNASAGRSPRGSRSNPNPTHASGHSLQQRRIRIAKAATNPESPDVDSVAAFPSSQIRIK